MTPELSNTLAQLANKLGVSAERLWPILVAREKTEALFGLGFSVLCGVAAVLLAFKARRSIRKDRGGPSEVTFFSISGSAVLSIIFLVGSIGSYVDYKYPEIAAVKTLLHR